MYGNENVTINGKTLSVKRLGNGVSTTAYQTNDKRYANGKKVLLFTQVYDIVKEGISKHLQSTNRLNVHIPRIRRIGVGYDDSNNFCLVYESPFYNVFADSSYGVSTGIKARKQYESVSDNLSYGYGGIDNTRLNVECANIPTGIKSAMLDILAYAKNAKLPESEWYGLDLHSGNGAYDNKGRLILLDVFHNGGLDAKTFVECYESQNEVYIESGRMSDYDRLESEYGSPSYVASHTPNKYCNCNACQSFHAHMVTYLICANPTWRIRACRTWRISHGKWYHAPCTYILRACKTLAIRAKRTMLIVAPKTPLVVTREYNIILWPKWIELEIGGKWGYALTDSDYELLAKFGYRHLMDSCAVMVTVYAHNYDTAVSRALHNGNELLRSDKLEY